MCTALFYYTCVYIYSLLNSCGYWTLNKYYYYYNYFTLSSHVNVLLFTSHMPAVCPCISVSLNR